MGMGSVAPFTAKKGGLRSFAPTECGTEATSICSPCGPGLADLNRQGQHQEPDAQAAPDAPATGRPVSRLT